MISQIALKQRFQRAIRSQCLEPTVESLHQCPGSWVLPGNHHMELICLHPWNGFCGQALPQVILAKSRETGEYLIAGKKRIAATGKRLVDDLIKGVGALIHDFVRNAKTCIVVAPEAT